MVLSEFVALIAPAVRSLKSRCRMRAVCMKRDDLRFPAGRVPSRKGIGRIQAMLKADRWAAAARLIRAELGRVPTDHWLLIHLSLTHYERRQYVRAAYYSSRAFLSDPKCPLVVWHHGGNLAVLGRIREAIGMYRRLLRAGARKVAYGKCGEGLRWADSLLCDCCYCLAIWYEKLNDATRASRYAREYFKRRRRASSIFPLASARRRLSSLTG
jgi:tetratricopeptide (TPR) repeat protein